MTAPRVIWQVVATSRPDCLANVWRGFTRQLHDSRRLCLVCNGPAWTNPTAQVWNAGVRPDLLLTSAPGKPAALNTAFQALRGQWLAVRDDDDVQMPGDLLDVVTAQRRTAADIVSRHKHWVYCQDSDRLWLLGEHLANKEAEDPYIAGGSFLFYNGTATPEVPNRRVGECVKWARAMVAKGARIWRPGLEHQVFIRGRHDHLFEADEAKMVRIYARAPKARLYKPSADAQRAIRGELNPFELPHEIKDLTNL